MTNLNEYLKWLRINSLSKKTINNYIYQIRQFLQFIEYQEVTKENIEDFFLHLKNKYKESTINKYLTAINSYLKFLDKNILIPKPIKTDRVLPKVIDEKIFENEIVPMVEIIFNDPFKVKTILYFMFYTGLRKGEIAKLKREQFDLEKNQVKLYMPKSKRERFMFYPNKVKELLSSFFSVYLQGKYGAFNIKSGRNIDYYIFRLKKYFKNLNLKPHLFRHSFSVHYIKKGGRIAALQRFLGHRSRKSTEIYAQFDTETLQNDYNKFIEEEK